MSAPLELTQLEWERELSEFQAQLTPELRSLLPDVRSRQAPLANLKTAQPIADLLKNRFRPEDSSLSVAKVTLSTVLVCKAPLSYLSQNPELKSNGRKQSSRSVLVT